LSHSKSRQHIFSQSIDQYFTDVYNAWLFVVRFFKEAFKSPFHFSEVVHQCYEIGVRSLPLISLTGFVTGIVFTKQSRPSLAEFGATSWLPSLISIAIVRALASLVTSLICSGKVGSSIGAELGSMKVTEQIDAMEVSAINPYKYLVVTRIMAATLLVPLLVIFADGIGILGGFFGVNIHSDVNMVRYFTQVLESLDFIDIVPATIKTFFFGFFIGMIGCYKGFTAANGTESVGKAANSAVVNASLAIFIIDMLAVQLTDLFF
jgi:phospholipid/cholesterol/gamma-HCH transport system permease protein